MDVSGLVQYNNSEGDRISSIAFQKLIFFVVVVFFQDEYRYLPVFQSDYAISQLQRRWDRTACNPQSKQKRVLEKQARQQSAKKQKQFTNFSDTDRAKSANTLPLLLLRACM